MKIQGRTVTATIDHNEELRTALDIPNNQGYDFCDSRPHPRPFHLIWPREGESEYQARMPQGLLHVLPRLPGKIGQQSRCCHGCGGRCAWRSAEIPCVSKLPGAVSATYHGWRSLGRLQSIGLEGRRTVSCKAREWGLRYLVREVNIGRLLFFQERTALHPGPFTFLFRGCGSLYRRGRHPVLWKPDLAPLNETICQPAPLSLASF